MVYIWCDFGVVLMGVSVVNDLRSCARTFTPYMVRILYSFIVEPKEKVIGAAAG